MKPDDDEEETFEQLGAVVDRVLSKLMVKIKERESAVEPAE